MGSKESKETYDSIGIKQLIYPVYNSMYNILVSFEEGYSKKGFKKPIIVIERGKVTKTRYSTPIFEVKKPIYKNKFKDLHINKKDKEYLKRYLGISRYNDLIGYIRQERKDVEKYNKWLEGKRERYKSLEKPVSYISAEETPILSIKDLYKNNGGF